MKKIHDMLKSKEEVPKLSSGNMFEQGQRAYFYKRRRTYRKWYVIYMSTAIATVATVTLLLVFGVSSGNRAIGENLSLGKLADKICGMFANLDFTFSSNAAEESNDFDFIKQPKDTEKVDSENKDTQKEDDPSTDVSTNRVGLYDYDYSLVPEGHTPIIPMDLSLSSYGSGYINNATGYEPNVIGLINKNLKDDGVIEQLSATSGPLVLIIHTHGTEGYSPDGAISTKDDIDARTMNTQKNVVAIGKNIADILNKNGVPTAHCTIMHDSVQYKDSYARAEETIKKYIEEYPTIKLVIDIHRDSIIKSSGEIVRPVAELERLAAAQVMCVVGTDWEGDACPNWENNLSLALKLRESLNAECENICRPVFLKSHTYNQEIAPYSLLIEIGASGNSIEEAQRSANLIGKKLCELIDQI